MIEIRKRLRKLFRVQSLSETISWKKIFGGCDSGRGSAVQEERGQLREKRATRGKGEGERETTINTGRNGSSQQKMHERWKEPSEE